MNAKDIIEEIKNFRENPKNFIENKRFLGARIQKDYTNFINSLEKMGELIIDDDLNDIAKNEILKFKDDENYPCIRVGKELSEINFKENIDKDSVSLIAIEEFQDINSLIPKIISNPSDKDKKGRLILTDQTNTHIGLCLDEEFIILIFAKKIKINVISNQENETQSNSKSSTLPDIINENNIEETNTKKVEIISESKNIQTKDYFFFFSFTKDKINKYKIKGFQNKNGNFFLINEVNQEYEDYKERDTIFKIYYFKISIEPEKCHYFKIELLQNQDIILQSEEIFLTENCLGYIPLYKNKKLNSNQENFKKEEILMQNKKLLSLFNVDKNYMKDLIKKYKVENKINISVLIEISNMCCEYECFPFFFKDLKKEYINYESIYNIKENQKDMFDKLYNLIEAEKGSKDNIDEIKSKCFLTLLDIYGTVYYKYDKNSFINLLNKEDQLFIYSASRLISNQIINLNDLLQIKGLEKNKIIPLIIKNVCTGEELKKIFQFSKNIIEALNLINNYYELIIEKLKNKSD